MKKTLAKGLALAVVGSLMVAGSAMALPNGTALQDALNVRTQGGTSSVDVYNDMLSDAYDSAWNISGSSQSAATLLFEFAGYAPTTSFGIYDLNNSSNRLELFTGTDANNGTPFDGALTTLSVFDNTFSVDGFTTSTTFSTRTFGYYLGVAAISETWFSDTSINSDDADHLLAYQGVDDAFSVYNNDIYATWNDNEWILAWDDQSFNGADRDYTDFVVMVESVSPVPEPTTMLLFGTGLVGLAGISRRRRNTKNA